eukprot:SAG31_NODE_21445_length_549_cov_1.186667_1_plen_84_part_00
MQKPLSTALGASQVQMGMLRYAHEAVQRVVCAQVNQFLLTGSIPNMYLPTGTKFSWILDVHVLIHQQYGCTQATGYGRATVGT